MYIFGTNKDTTRLKTSIATLVNVSDTESEFEALDEGSEGEDAEEEEESSKKRSILSLDEMLDDLDFHSPSKREKVSS